MGQARQFLVDYVCSIRGALPTEALELLPEQVLSLQQFLDYIEDEIAIGKNLLLDVGRITSLAFQLRDHVERALLSTAGGRAVSSD